MERFCNDRFSISTQKWRLKIKILKEMLKIKGLDMVDTVPEELWTEVHNIV